MSKIKVKELIDYLKDHEDFELEIFTTVYAFDTITTEPEKVIQIGELNLYDKELLTKKVILEFITDEKLMYMNDLELDKCYKYKIIGGN